MGSGRHLEAVGIVSVGWRGGLEGGRPEDGLQEHLALPLPCPLRPSTCRLLAPWHLQWYGLICGHCIVKRAGQCAALRTASDGAVEVRRPGCICNAHCWLSLQQIPRYCTRKHMPACQTSPNDSPHDTNGVMLSVNKWWITCDRSTTTAHHRQTCKGRASGQG
jgi:hypothetical protein